MQEPRSNQSEPIRLEMSRRSKIGCTLIVVGTIALIVIACMVARVLGRSEAVASTTSIYVAAQKSDYERVEKFITPSAMATLRKADDVNGRVSSFQITAV